MVFKKIRLPDKKVLISASLGIISVIAIVVIAITLSNSNTSLQGKSVIIETATNLSWEKQPAFTTKDMHKVAFIDENNGYVVGDKGTLLRYTNGTWTDISSKTQMNSDINGLYFIDKNTGWIVGSSGEIHSTSDGGNSWNKQFPK